MRLALFLVLSVSSLAQTSVIRCGKLVDVRAGKTIPNAVIVVVGPAVSASGPADSITIPSGATTIDLSKYTCMPGMIDVHDHLTGDPMNSGYKSIGISVPRSALTGARNARTTLLAGFTTVRNVGAHGYSDVALRDVIEAGDR